MGKVIKGILIALGTIVLVIIIAVAVLLGIASYKNNNYWNYTETGGDIEAKYTALGEYEVSYVEFDASNETYKKYEIWYPSEMKDSTEKYPLVVFANGTGVPASSYKAVFKHLASWGFIVVGNEDENSRTGASSAATLDFILGLNEDSESDFYGKVDTDNIGISGHSQGGVGAINAVTNQSNGHYYKVIYTASATSSFWSQESELGTEWSYDLSKINIPYFMVAGTGYFDAGEAADKTAAEAQGICPLYSMIENYNNISDTVPKIRARRTDIDHGDMLRVPDGYMTAWFMYYLKGDVEAGNALMGDNAEILNNANWQDIEKNH